jgi:NADPH:quinone reductase-like Zn-dependent oxidoreductase
MIAYFYNERQIFNSGENTMTTMKAVRQHEYGDVDVLKYEDAPKPEAAEGEVLVKVQAAGINPVDWKTRSGRGMAGMYPNPFPLILGWDISGVVEAVGSNANKFKVGDEVFGMIHFPQIGSAYAEYISAPETQLALKPKNVSHVEAAAIPLAALTAWQGLFECGSLEKGQHILIHAAAGGVGHLAVQLAKWKGAHIIGTASAHNFDYLRALGVDELVDYNAAPFEDVVQPVDMVFDCVGGDIIPRSFKVVKEGGSFVTIAGKPDENEAAARKIRAGNFLVRPVEEHLAQIAALMAEGHLKPTVEQIFPLTEVGNAHTLSAEGHVRGKIVLQLA